MTNKYVSVDLKKANKQPFSDLYHIVQALESMRCANGVLNMHINNLIKWNYQQNDNNISIIINKLLKTLNNSHSDENDFYIKNLIQKTRDILPKKPLKDFKEQNNE